VLSKCDATWLYEHGAATLHDAELTSLTAGEASLDGGILSYFDGRLLMVVGDAYRGTESPGATALTQFIRDRSANQAVEAVYFIGPDPVNLRFLRATGFKRLESIRRSPQGAEMFIPCRKVQRERVFCRASRLPLEARVAESTLLTARHLRLVEELFTSRPLTCFLEEMALAMSGMLRLPETLRIEAWSDGALVGFILIRKPFRDVALAPFMTHDRLTPRVCDFLYANAVIESDRLRATHLNVGASPSRGQFFFKSKWHGIAGAPTYSCLWIRKVIARGYNYGWGPRLVGL
jgi:hypothetical protein